MENEQHMIGRGGTVEAVLASFMEAHIQEEPVTIRRLGGYSNKNYGITSGNGNRYTARVARLNRTAKSVAAEEYILQALQEQAVAVPALLPQYPVHSRLQCSDGLHYLHFFDHINGSIDCFWWQQCSIPKLQQLFEQLAVLHQAMHMIPPLPSYTAACYRYTLPEQTPALLAATATGRYVQEHWQLFRAKASALQQQMATQFPWQQARLQWIHGDIQLENVLFEKDRFSAFLDFELASWDACEKDVILSAFRTCKEGNTDAPFQYDAARLAIALEAYCQVNPALCSDFFNHYDDLWKPFFCLDQSMVYLINAFDGIWQLEKGIGFLPCFNEVLQYH